MKITTQSLIRASGPAAIVGGLSYALVGVFHPPNILASVTTPVWLVVHILAMGTSIFGLLGLTGIYARQAEKSGWLGLAGYLLLTLWLALILGFTFVEVFILPTLATVAPAFVDALASGYSTARRTGSTSVLCRRRGQSAAPSTSSVESCSASRRSALVYCRAGPVSCWPSGPRWAHWRPSCRSTSSPRSPCRPDWRWSGSAIDGSGRNGARSPHLLLPRSVEASAV